MSNITVEGLPYSVPEFSVLDNVISPVNSLPSAIEKVSVRRHIGRRIAAVAMSVAAVFTGMEATDNHEAQADPKLVYNVVDADIGFYYRDSPHLGDTKRITGVGIYTGDKVELICGKDGDPVGNKNNTWWHYVKNLSRPGIGEGWIPDHNTTTPNKAGERTPNEKECGQDEPKQPVFRSVFFSPLKSPTGLDGLPGADLNITRQGWSSGDCSPDKVLNDFPPTIETIATWSRGRNSVAYFLAIANESQLKQVHRIIIFDPGAVSDMARNLIKEVLRPDLRTCDWRYDTNSNLAAWLKMDSQNQLYIISGKDTAMKVGESPTFEGLITYYLKGVWDKQVAERVTVCDYDSMEHEDVIREFSWMIKDFPGGCAQSSNGEKLVSWHPRKGG